MSAPSVAKERVRRGDTLVLCSDGLSGQVSRDDIAAYVRDDDLHVVDLATGTIVGSWTG